MDKPSNAVTESAKNPAGQHGTMSNAAVGKPHCGSPDLLSVEPKVISPTSTIGHNSLEHGGKK